MTPPKIHRTLALALGAILLWMIAGAPVLFLPTTDWRLVYAIALSSVLAWAWSRRVRLDFMMTRPEATASVRLVVSMALGAQALAAAMEYWIPGESFEAGYLDPAVPTDLLSLCLLALVAAPLAEEWIFRGYLLTRLRASMSDTSALVICALMFAAAHFQPHNLPVLFVIGVMLTCIMIRTQRLWLAAVGHAAVNLGAGLPTALQHFNLGKTSGIGYPITALIVAALMGFEFWRALTTTTWKGMRPPGDSSAKVTALLQPQG